MDRLALMFGLMFAAFAAGHFVGWSDGRKTGCAEGRASITCPPTTDNRFMYDNGSRAWVITCPKECRCNWEAVQ